LLKEIEKYLQKFNITFVYVIAEKLVEYGDQDPERYYEEDFLACISNREKVLEIVRDPTMKFKGPGGHEMAATMIQKLWKGYRSSSNFKQLKFLMQKATIIQRRFRLYQLKAKTSQKLKDLRKE